MKTLYSTLVYFDGGRSDAPCRVFRTMREYRQWAAQTLPEYLGFRPAQVIMREEPCTAKEIALEKMETRKGFVR